MGMSGDTALVLAKSYVKKTLQGQGALKGQDGFSPTVKENPSNTDNDYRLDITDKNGTITTPNLKGADGSGSDYKQLKNKPSIGGVEIDGNKTLDDLGIQPKGEYLTEETDPTVPQWAKENTKPTYTASEVGADSVGSADMALSNAKEYTNNKIAELINGAPETMDTLKEIADALETEQSTVEVLQEAIGTKLNKDGDSKDNIVTFVQSETRENIDSGDKHSVLFGKIRKWLFDLKEVAFSGSYTDLNNKPSAEDIGALPKDGNATSATKATNDGDGNNIAETYATKIQVDEINSNLDTLGYGEIAGGKNLLNVSYTNKVYNGITFDFDKTLLQINGTSTTSFAVIQLKEPVVLDVGTYKGSYATSDTIPPNIYLRGKNAQGNTVDLHFARNLSYTLTERISFDSLGISGYESGESFNAKINLQIEKGTTSSQYKPYIPSVKMLSDEVDKQNESLSVIGKCKNLLKPTLGTTEKNGVTCTNNGDGTYTLNTPNGAATGNTWLILAQDVQFDNIEGKDVIYQCVDDSSKVSGSYFQCKDSSLSVIGTDFEQGTVHTVPSGTEYISAVVAIYKDKVVNDLLIKPMLVDAEKFPDAIYDDFVPYTGDGDTLMDDVASINNDLGGLSFSVSDGTLSITDGTNTWTLPQTT